ncbi:MAG: endopeptidase La [Verrucomicrobiae bacterium]|nr:endopeptidase La [Verrucomicrobiae bacterium]MCX7722330.1 endopeptidase La [Verrucomicrobiae bacterium]MDW7979595.1 endopeptidase La [Verrucomicrobiales bacterium]
MSRRLIIAVPVGTDAPPDEAPAHGALAGGSQGAAEQPPVPETLPILPIRNTVLFPGTVSPLTIGRPSSRKLLEESLPKSKIIGIFAQKDPKVDEPGPGDLHKLGVAAMVLKLFRPSEEQVVIIVQALQRIAIRKVLLTHPFMRAEVEVVQSKYPVKPDKEFEATVQGLRDSALKLVELTLEQPEPVKMLILNLDDPGALADFLAGSINIEAGQKQELLEELDVVKRVQAVHRIVTAQLELAQLQQKIQKDVTSSITEQQRKAYLREQLRAIQKELGETDDVVGQQVSELRRRIEEAQPPKTVMEQAERELRRLAQLHPASPEYSVIVSYLETIADLPWNKLTEDNLDLDRAQKILDRDHFNLQKVKRRLIEYLAVRKLNPSGHGPILCLVGPPGVGKTSLGQSIADALGRKFVRLSLGGVHDEAEIRGHRRTYIGSMPGRIIQEIRRAGSRNPVMMLDEIDKIGSDFRGDPASALLEVLDPRQNNAFVDHYLDVPFDLSQVMFICTANVMDTVPPALRDRLEVIELPGYTDHEKLEIARRYLVKRQLKEHGLKNGQCKFQTAALVRIIRDYTREAGVRELERQIAAVCRAIAAKVAKGRKTGTVVTPELVERLLGPPKYIHESKLKTGRPGVVTGLAWTPTGGDILHIEALHYPGKGNILLTGQIGDVMKESAQAALSLVKSRARELNIPPDVFKETDIHVHVPAGAVPKDGPSAGVAIFTAIASLFSNRPVRPEVAMTGEITLRGLVLPIGGLKEKALAAQRAGIKTVLIPKLNEKDLVELPPEVRHQIRFKPVETVDQVLEAALLPAKNGQ